MSAKLPVESELANSINALDETKLNKEVVRSLISNVRETEGSIYSIQRYILTYSSLFLIPYIIINYNLATHGRGNCFYSTEYRRSQPIG